MEGQSPVTECKVWLISTAIVTLEPSSIYVTGYQAPVSIDLSALSNKKLGPKKKNTHTQKNSP